MAALLKWRVGEAPTGRFRAFCERAWPTADARGEAVAHIRAKASYEPRIAETTELEVFVADRSKPGPFKWRRMNIRPVGVTEAKRLAAKFFEAHPEWLPKEEGK